MFVLSLQLFYKSQLCPKKYKTFVVEEALSEKASLVFFWVVHSVTLVFVPLFVLVASGSSYCIFILCLDD